MMASFPTSEQAQARIAAQRVLIVDDEPSMARAIERVVRQAGFEAALAHDGFTAGSLLHTFRPALMILDLRMPGINGLGVIKFMRGKCQIPTDCKILVLSGDTADQLEYAVSIGADGAMAKPFDNEALLAEVRRLCDGA